MTADPPTVPPAVPAADAVPTAPKAGPLRTIWEVLLTAANAWQDDKATRLSAAVAMYTILSLSPLVVITLKVTAVVLSKEAADRQVKRQLEGQLGHTGAEAVNEMIKKADDQKDAGVLATAISVGVLLFTASGVFVELRDALHTVWGLDPKLTRGVWPLIKERLLSLGMVFGIGFLLLVSLVVSTTLSGVSEHVVGEEVKWSARTVDFVASTVVITLLFGMLFRFLPDVRIAWTYVLAGSFATAVLFQAGKYLQAFYFSHISTGSAYGAAGSFVVVMLWVYYSSWILFFGAELIKAYANRHGANLGPAAAGGGR